MNDFSPNLLRPTFAVLFRGVLIGLILALCACGVSGSLSAQPFALTDSAPEGADFRERFLGSYGVNSDIEPAIDQEARELYQQVAPFLQADPARALREVEQAIEEESPAALRFLLGNLYYQTERFGESERSLQRAVEQFPDFRRAHRTLGLIYTREQRHEEAIEAWLKVITLGGGDAQSYGLLAYAYLSRQKYESALSAYKMARMFKPDSIDFRRGEAQSLLETDQLNRAVALFEELIAEDPSTGEYWLLQGNAFLRLERYDDAIANLEVVQNLGRQTRDSTLLLADLHLRNDNHRPALEYYKQALSALGDLLPRSVLRPLNLLLSRGLMPEAQEYLRVLRDHLPEAPDPDLTTGIALAESRFAFEDGNMEEALRPLASILETNPLNGEALLLSAQIHQRNEALESAEFYLQRALSVPEKKVDALIALGRLEVTRGNFAQALEHLRTAQEMEPRAGLRRYIASIEEVISR